MDRSNTTHAAVTFILLTSALDALAFGLSIPVLPKLFEAFTAGNAAKAAVLYGEYASVYALILFACSPLLGALSDTFGRRRVLLISLVGLALDYVLMGWAPSILWLFVGRIISGATAATQSTVYAYATDVTDLEHLPAALGRIEAAWAAGFLLGPALGGVLGSLSLRLPFWVAAGMTCASAFYGYFWLPESLEPAQLAPFRLARAHPLGALLILKSNRRLRVPLVTLALSRLAAQALPTLFVLYASARFHWNTLEVGAAIALSALCAFFIQGVGVRQLTRRLSLSVIIQIALALDALAFFGCALAWSGPTFLAAILLNTVASVFFPVNLALMSETVDKSSQGKLQGLCGSLVGLTSLFGPLLFSEAFRYGTSTMFSGLRIPGLAFLLAAGFLLIALALVMSSRDTARAASLKAEFESAKSG